MKLFSILTVVLVIMLIISACGSRGAQAVPTVDPVAIQDTMAAAAFTMVAETQAAIPTATPPPPTETATNTPAPTDTPPPLPPSDVTLTPVPNGNSGGDDPCVQTPLPASLQGETTRMRINNSTKATMRISVYLNRSGSQGQCGYRAFNLDPGQFVVVNELVVGCYTLFAWNVDPDEYFIVTNGTTCVDSADTWVFDITTRSITVRT